MTDLEEAIYNTMLDSEMNALYYGYIARRYERRERIYQIFVAVLATSSIASLQLWRMEISWFKWVWMWDVLSIVAVIITVALPFIKLNNIANKASELRPIFQKFKNEYESLWLQRDSLKESTLRVKFKNLKQDEIQQTKTDSNMPRDIKLLEKCQDEIIKGRGLN